MKHLIAIVTLATLMACASTSRDDSDGRRLIQNKGSDSMVTVALAWAEAYKKVAPDVGVAVSAGGSRTGIAGLLNGTVDIANATRTMTPDELEQAERHGIRPAEMIVGYDAPAFIVHEDNPIDRFSLDQLAEIYGEGGATERWSQLGVRVPGCESDEIVRVARQDSSGTQAHLRRRVLGPERNYKLGSRDMQGSIDVVRLVSRTPCAIGYTALAYAPPAEVKIPCIVTGDEGDCSVPSIQSAVDGTYPLARPLLMYTDGEPSGVVKDFVDWVVGDEGQCLVRHRGYAPLRPVFCP
ncbi:MAG: phosphate ABC transporter substrate-binding protein [bacterium]|nr:phosphate ABC transporter substrate-binding protein [bacterium]